MARVYPARSAYPLRKYFDPNPPGVIIPAPASDWRFNDGSGAVALDNKGVASITFGTTPTWGAGFADDSASGNSTWNTPNGTYRTLTDFTIAMWLTPAVVDASTYESVCIGTGGGSGVTNYAMYLANDNSVVNWRVSNSAAASLAGVSLTLTNSDVWLVFLRYTRTGGAGDNIMKIDVTKDGSWTSGNNNAAGLFTSTSSMELCRRRNATTPANFKYYRLSVWTSVLTDTDRDNIFAAGSESTDY